MRHVSSSGSRQSIESRSVGSKIHFVESYHHQGYVQLTPLNVGGDCPEEVDDVGMLPQVTHYLQLGHQGLENIFVGVGIQSFNGHCGLGFILFDS